MYSKILALGLLFVSTACDAAVLPPVESLTVGGRVILKPKSVRVLIGVDTTTFQVSTLRTITGSTAGYQVPSGKTFNVLAIRCQNPSTATQFTFGYGDNDVGNAGSTPPTNSVTPGAFAELFTLPDTSVATYPNGVFEYAFAEPFVVPALKYLYMQQSGGSSYNFCQVYGTEQ